jgi:rod shape determining protein RodA
MLQPDLGTALIILLTFLSMMLFIKIQPRTLLIIGICASIALPIIYKFGLKPYQRQRLVTFINPASDPKGTGYNSIQSMIAVGSGQLLGKGYKKGTQSQLNFLPEHHTDFIFSIIGEELGFLGAGAVILLFIVFIFAGMVIVFRSKDLFSQLFGLGLVSLVGLEAVINIGVSIGALPTKGLSLPFISYGGSALLANMAAAGFILNVSNDIPPEMDIEPLEAAP